MFVTSNQQYRKTVEKAELSQRTLVLWERYDFGIT